jgi:hypothetical protein
MRKTIMAVILMALAGCAEMQSDVRVGGTDVKIKSDGGNLEVGVKNEDIDIEGDMRLPEAPENR